MDNQFKSSLDRFLVSEGWESHFNGLIQCTLPKPVSDHSSILLDGGGMSSGLKIYELDGFKICLKVHGRGII